MYPNELPVHDIYRTRVDYRAKKTCAQFYTVYSSINREYSSEIYKQC